LNINLGYVVNFALFNTVKVILEHFQKSSNAQWQQKQQCLKMGPEQSTFWTQHVGLDAKKKKSHTLQTHTHSDFIKPTNSLSVCCLGLKQGLGKQSSPFLFKRTVTREAWLASGGEKGRRGLGEGTKWVCAPPCWSDLLWPRRQGDEAGKPIGMPHWSPESHSQDFITLNRKIEMIGDGS